MKKKDNILGGEEAESVNIQMGILESVEKGFLEQVIREDGEIAYKITPKGVKYMEKILQTNKGKRRLGMTRQRKWQIRQEALGNCRTCGTKRDGKSRIYCTTHRQLQTYLSITSRRRRRVFLSPKGKEKRYGHKEIVKKWKKI